jgi:NitT/TauT family transport system permease protein
MTQIATRHRIGAEKNGDARKIRSLLSAALRIPLFWQIVLCGAVLAIWQWGPSIPNIKQVIVWADPFFISSPSRCAVEIGRLFVGNPDTPTIWAPLARTVFAALGGTAAAVFCSHWELLNRISRPILTLLNAIPKITIIPIIVLIASSSAASDSVVAFIIVFFVIFYNAAEGGAAVPKEMLQLASLLGAPPVDLMLKIRGPFVLVWTLSQIPNAIAFGLTGTVTAELFTGSNGIGGILIAAINTQDADLTFAVVFILAAVGVVLVLGLDMLRRRILHWW